MKCRALWLVFGSCLSAVQALKNITIDDTNFDMIQYKGDQWEKIMLSLDYGGSHRLGTDVNASATFTFTGVAVYYLSALWPYSVNTTLKLDDQDPEQLNLTDPVASPADGGSASSSYAVHWGRTGLANTTHKLVVYTTADQKYPWTVVDGFIYTIDDSADATSTDASTAASDANITAIIIGAAIGALTLLIALALAVFCWRRRRKAQRHAQQQPIEDHSWRNVLPSATSDPPLVSQLTHTPFTPDDTSVTNTSVSSTRRLVRARTESTTNLSEFNPYDRPLTYATSTTTSSDTNNAGYGAGTNLNFAGLGAGGLAVANPTPAASSSNANTAMMQRYVDEKRAQTLALTANMPLPPPAYSASLDR
ncbi:hypothetical protein BDZ89DRAFT_1157288 [Hymenopellis radicata]|nr:hypothetical protein BDZ89DRAFT_1157288 [Hymenopellis radicata]